MSRFWKWRNDLTEAGGARELVLDGPIDEETWFDDAVTPAAFRDELNAGSGNVLIRINSPGGDCVAAARIYEMMREYKDGKVTVLIDGMAASAASVIAMAGEEVLMTPVSLMMIHNPWSFAAGNAEEMRQAAEMLDEVAESIVNAYELKTGLSRSKLRELMDNETWMSAGKAMALGFCDAMATKDGDKTGEAAASWSIGRATTCAAMEKALEQVRANPAKPETPDENERKLHAARLQLLRNALTEANQ